MTSLLKGSINVRITCRWACVAILSTLVGSPSNATAQQLQQSQQALPDLSSLFKPPEAVIDGMKFTIYNSSGVAVEPTAYVGPMFTLSQTTVITDIGGFVNHHSGTDLMRIIVVRAANGVPDPSRIYGVFPMTGKADFYAFSYESANMALVLKPGTYFALFATQGTDRAVVLGSSGGFQGGVFNTGVIDPTGATAPHAIFQYLAVKIQGKRVS